MAARLLPRTDDTAADTADTGHRFGVDPARTPRDGDVVVVTDPGGPRPLVGLLRERDGEQTVLTADRVLRLGGHVLLGVVSVVVRDI